MYGHVCCDSPSVPTPHCLPNVTGVRNIGLAKFYFLPADGLYGQGYWVGNIGLSVAYTGYGQVWNRIGNIGLLGCQTIGPFCCGDIGLLGCQTIGPFCCGDIGLLGCQTIGPFCCGDIGLLGCQTIGPFCCGDIGLLGCQTIGPFCWGLWLLV